WKMFLQRLSDAGLLMVSRWYDSRNVGETGRLVSLAVASLLAIGLEDPVSHVALITSDRVATLVVSRQPLSGRDVETLRGVSNELGYHVVHLPDNLAADPVLGRILRARTLASLDAATRHPYFNYSPPTDENPYFFNMLRLTGIPEVLNQRDGVVRGNVVAAGTLISLLVVLFAVTVATIVLPLALPNRASFHVGARGKRFWGGALYFSLIGAGFMFLEIALIQRLSLFLGHPTYALGILLFTLISSAGVGSFLSDRLTTRVGAWVLICPVA